MFLDGGAAGPPCVLHVEACVAPPVTVMTSAGADDDEPRFPP